MHFLYVGSIGFSALGLICVMCVMCFCHIHTHTHTTHPCPPGMPYTILAWVALELESGAPHALMVGLPVLACNTSVLTLQMSALHLSSGCIPAYAAVIVLALQCKAIGTTGAIVAAGAICADVYHDCVVSPKYMPLVFSFTRLLFLCSVYVLLHCIRTRPRVTHDSSACGA